MNLHSNEKSILIAVIVCVLLMSCGYSFAYFVTSNTVSGNGGTTNIKTANTANVKYDAGSSSITLDNAQPGTTGSKSFSITVLPTESQNTTSYSIKLVIDTNTFVKCSDANYDAVSNACIKDSEELVYTLTDGEGGVFTGDITGKTGEIVLLNEKKTVDAETIYNYNLEINYKNTGADQNHNFSKTLDASLKVDIGND